MEIVPFLLLSLFGVAVAIGAGVILVTCHPRGAARRIEPVGVALAGDSGSGVYWQRPACWLAVKGRNLLAVKRAFGLQKAKPCSWIQGLCRDEKVFIAPPVKGWILVFGSELPNPAEDIDGCFRFMVRLSRKLGHVQLFSANRVLQHHAWIRLENGKVVRAYAWAGQTLWVQGSETSAEKELDMACYDYFESAQSESFGTPERVIGNVEKVPALAARWSLDPGRLSEPFLEAEFGVAGEPCLRD